MEPPIGVRIGNLLEIRSSKLPPNHSLQPQTIQPLNMILPEKPEDDLVLNNLSSHLSGELPNVDLNPQKASEVTTSEVASERPQQQAPGPQMTPSSPEHSVPEHTTSEQSVPDHIVLEQTTSDHNPAPTHSENTLEIDDMITSEDLNEEADQPSPMEVE